MKRIILVCILLVTIVFNGVHAQEEENKYKTEVSGIVWYQMYYDTYQNVESRDGALLLYPLALDANKINETGKLGSSAFFSRLRVKFSGTKAFGADVSGVLEGDFFGTTQENIAHLRLRHAFVKLNWDRSSLLMGQYWHTIIDTDVIPACDLIANLPFFPLNRSPQLSYTYKFGSGLSLNGAAIVHSYHRSSGPSLLQRNAPVPEFAGKLKYKSDAFVFGVNGGIKTLQPRIVTELGVSTNKRISTPYFGTFAKVKTEPVTFRAQLVYGENLTHFVMIGGMGAKGDTTGIDDFDYSPLKTLAAWADLHTNGKKVQGGLFFGYTKNLGSKDDYMSFALDGAALNRSDKLVSVMRIAPRVDFFAERFKLGIEYSLTSAIWGETFDSKQVATAEFDPVTNSRILLNVMYKF